MVEIIGASLPRVEDRRLIQGQGCYVGDERLPGILVAAFVRCPHGHARVLDLALEQARGLPGVVGAFGPGDLPALSQPLPVVMQTPEVDARMGAPLTAEPRYHGEAVAVVVAEDAYRAADGVAAIAVAYEPLPAVTDTDQALADNAPAVHADRPDNIAGRLRAGFGPVEDAFANAEVVVEAQLRIGRSAGLAMEPRVVLAAPNGEQGVRVTLWDSTQAPHAIRHGVATALGLSDGQIRVITPDVGGGFGPKGRLYPEEVVVAALALHLGRPVRWEATRSEDLLTTYLGRGVTVHAALAARQDGTIVGLRAQLVQDSGAYTPTGAVVPRNSLQHLLGPYHIPAFAGEIVVVYTNGVPLSPVRGGGRESGVFVIERLMDHLACRLGRDPIDLRLQNAIGSEEMPYDTHLAALQQHVTIIYDSGDYPSYLRQAREAIDYEAIKRAQAEERARGIYRGVAVTAYVEGTGVGEETARVEVREDGTVQAILGSPSNGQGHATSLAQMCAARLGVPVACVRVQSGDTGAMGTGVGTFGSRMAIMGGNAVAQAAAALRAQLLRAAAALLEAPEGEVDLVDGVVRVASRPCLSLADLARQLAERSQTEALRATATFAPQRPTAFAGGAHAAVVRVDTETGRVYVERYVVVDDSGTPINPMIVDGQVEGGVAQGLGNVLLERMVRDETGKVLTADMPDYGRPLIRRIPAIEIEHQVHPSPNNPEGIKGAGEGGVIGALATITGAVEDALSPVSLRLDSIPLLEPDLAAACAKLA